MQRRRLGTNGPEVTRVGLGLAALGRPGYINLGHALDLEHQYALDLMEEHAHQVLDEALSAGVCYFDAARSYGEGERFLSTWLAKRLRRGDVVVASKWGYTYTAGWQVAADKHEIKDHSLAVLQRQAEESRSLLGNHLTLYQIHSATLESGVLDDLAVLRELGRLRESGWRIGLSITGPRQADTLHKALAVRLDGGRLFSAVQATWNLLERSAEPALVEAHAAGLGIIIKEALANGQLTARNDDPAFADRRRLLETTAERLGTSLDSLALAGVLAKDWADVVLSGAATVEQVRSNARAVSVKWDVEAEESLLGVRQGAEEYWQRRAALAWN